MQTATHEPLDLGVLFLRYRESGDVTAFQELMSAIYLPVFNYLFRLLRDRHDAEDALQEVWLKVIRQKENYDEQGHFISWVYRIAHNHCLDQYRKRERFKEEMNFADEDGIELFDRIAAPELSPRERLDEQEKMALLEKAVEKLPEAIREVYILRAIHDVPFKEIAEIQNAPLGTVLSRMHQAIGQLKKLIVNYPSSVKEMA